MTFESAAFVLTVGWIVALMNAVNLIDNMDGLAAGIAVIADLADRIRRLLASASHLTLVPYDTAYPTGFEDTPRRVADLGRAHDVLGYSPTVTFDEGLASTLAWCRVHFAAAGERR